MLVAMSDTFRLTVAVRRRSEINYPSSEEDAIAVVQDLLSQGLFFEVLSVAPEQAGPDKHVRWG